MAADTRLSNAAANAACNAVVDLIDAGAGAGTIKIYDGTIPTNADTAIGAQNLLVTLTCSDPAFGNAADGVATADTITSGTAVDTGTAAWARVADSDGNTVMDLVVGTADADIVLDTVAIVTDATVSISAWTHTAPKT